MRQQVKHGMCSAKTMQNLVCTNPSDLQPIQYGHNALTLASERGRTAIAQILLSARADPDSTTIVGTNSSWVRKRYTHLLLL
jgi:ankyrin repeat protein